MDVLRQLMDDARVVLRDMTTTQRVSVLTMILTVASLLTFAAWLGSIGEKTSMVALPMRVAPEDSNELLGQLHAQGIDKAKYDLQERQIHVPLEQRGKAIIFLSEQNMLPRDSASGFEQMLEKVKFNDTAPVTAERMRVALQNELRWMIEGIDGIKRAKVIYCRTPKKGVFRPSYKPRATVSIHTAMGKEFTQTKAEAIIRMVAYAHPGLHPADVIVTDQTGEHYMVSDTDNMSAAAAKAVKMNERTNENVRRRVELLVREYLAQYGKGGEAFAFVDTTWDFTKVVKDEKKVTEGSPSRMVKRSIKDQQKDLPGAETGARPEIAGAAELTEPGRRVTRDYDRKDSDAIYDTSHELTHTEQAPKIVKQTISVVVHLPHKIKTEKDAQGNETLVARKDAQGNAAKDPATDKVIYELESAIQDLPGAELDELEKSIKYAAGQAPGVDANQFDIAITTVPFLPDQEPPPLPPSATTQIREFMQDKMVPLVLLLILLVAVYFIYMQAKRSLPSEEIAVEEEQYELALPEMSEADKQHADFEALRNQVGELISENPGKAATLVRRWMTSREGF